LRDASSLKEGDEIHARLRSGSLKARVLSVDES